MLYLLNLIFSILLLFSQSVYAQVNSVDLGNTEVINSSNTSNSGSSELESKPKCLAKFIINVKNIINKLNASVLSLFSSTGSVWVRFFAALILGLLLSLTPCIFPMIPVTIGILQINPSTSKIKGFLTSLSYTLGISFTFSVIGLIAAFTTSIFGGFQASIWAILPFSAFLIYLGLSMFDFYEIKIPKFLQQKSTFIKQGTFISAFLFGAISGTVASSCSYPGIALIIDYVMQVSITSSLQGYLEGFLLLFVFGIGSSLPLLIMGTFSNASSFMPKAGQWMIEVKKLIGIMLIIMAFYHLSKLHNYIPIYLLLICAVMSFILLGIYYFKNVKYTDSKKLKIYKYTLGTILILGSLSFGLYKARYKQYGYNDVKGIWLKSFDVALKKSLEEKKLLFIDLGTSFCAACKSIDKAVFENPKVIKTIKDHYIPLKINYDNEPEDFDKIKNLYGAVKGFPTYMIVNNNKLVKKMGAELGELSIDDIVKLFIEQSNLPTN